MMECEHKHRHEVECSGDVRLTKYGYLCYAHAYRAFLIGRANTRNYEGKDNKDDDVPDMFADHNDK